MPLPMVPAPITPTHLISIEEPLLPSIIHHSTTGESFPSADPRPPPIHLSFVLPVTFSETPFQPRLFYIYDNQMQKEKQSQREQQHRRGRRVQPEPEHQNRDTQRHGIAHVPKRPEGREFSRQQPLSRRRENAPRT